MYSPFWSEVTRVKLQLHSVCVSSLEESGSKYYGFYTHTHTHTHMHIYIHMHTHAVLDMYINIHSPLNIVFLDGNAIN